MLVTQGGTSCAGGPILALDSSTLPQLPHWVHSLGPSPQKTVFWGIQRPQNGPDPMNAAPINQPKANCIEPYGKWN